MCIVQMGRAAYLEMPQLPYARRHEYTNLRERVPHRARVRVLAEIAEGGLALALVLLLAADVLELHVQVAQLLGELGDVRAVVFRVRLRAADDDVEVEPDVRAREPGRAVVAREADGVVTRVVRGEGETAFRGTSGLDNVVSSLELLQNTRGRELQSV